MSRNMLVLIGVLTLTAAGSSCGSDNRLLSIQAVPVDPKIANNNTVYATPGGVVPYQIQAWYSKRTVSTTIPSSQGHWSSTQPGVAKVDNNGVVTSVGPVGVTTIEVTVGEERATTTFAVCLPTALCPPVCDVTSCP